MNKWDTSVALAICPWIFGSSEYLPSAEAAGAPVPCTPVNNKYAAGPKLCNGHAYKWFVAPLVADPSQWISISS